MKVAILELHNYHYDVITSLCEIFEEKIEELYINNKLVPIISNRERIKKIKILKNNSILEKIKLIIAINKSNVNYVILGTNQSYLLFYFFFFLFCNKKIIMTMHNINVYFECHKTIKGIIKYIIRRLMLKKCYGINVLGETLKEELENKKVNKKIVNIPVRIYKKNISYDREQRKLIISIPGSFQLKRRDYETVYKACLLLKKDKKNIKINFLGKVEKKDRLEIDLLNKFKKNIDIFYSENFIDEKIFREKIYESNLLINPSVYETTYDGIKEYYGKTKQSGGIYTQIEFAKPGLTPRYIKLENTLKSSTLTYKDENELYRLLSKIYDNKNYAEFLMKEAQKNSEKYTIKKIREKIFKELEE